MAVAVLGASSFRGIVPGLCVDTVYLWVLDHDLDLVVVVLGAKLHYSHLTVVVRVQASRNRNLIWARGLGCSGVVRFLEKLLIRS